MINLRSVFFLIGESGPGVGYDTKDGSGPTGDDDGPDLPRLDPPRVGQQQLQVDPLAEHPRVRRQHEVVLDGVEDAAPGLK